MRYIHRTTRTTKGSSMYKIEFYTPESHLETVKKAMFEAGAGHLENYDCCCWQTRGIGQFRPLEGSNPYSAAIPIPVNSEPPKRIPSGKWKWSVRTIVSTRSLRRSRRHIPMRPRPISTGKSKLEHLSIHSVHQPDLFFSGGAERDTLHLPA